MTFDGRSMPSYRALSDVRWVESRPDLGYPVNAGSKQQQPGQLMAQDPAN
jgi:hypothetical protein